MEAGIIIGLLLLFVVILWYISRLVAKLAKVIITALIILIMLGVIGYVAWDFKDVNTRLEVDDKRFAYADSTQLLSTFSTSGDRVLPENDIYLYKVAYNARDYKRLRGSARTLLYFTQESFEGVDTVNVSGVYLTKDQALSLLANPQPKQYYINTYAHQNNVTTDLVSGVTLGTDDYLKGIVFAALVQELSNNQNLVMLARDNRIWIDPEGLLITVLRYIPDSLLPYLIEVPE